MSAVSQTKKLKITVTNIRSVLIKKTKRLANLKKINKRDTNSFLSLQKKRKAEKKLESPLKKEGSRITGLVSKTGNVLGLGKIFDVFKLLGLGVGVNAVFDNIDEITKGAKNLKKKVDSWLGNNEDKMDKVEKGLNKIDTNELKKMSDKFFNQSKKLDEEFEKLKDPSTVYYIPDPNNPDEPIGIIKGQFWLEQIKKEEERRGEEIPEMKNMDDWLKFKPTSPNDNLISLLNSNGSSGDTRVILARQNIIREV